MASGRVRFMHGVRGLAAGLLCCASASCGSDGTGPGSIADLPGGASPTLADLFGTVFYRADGSQASLQALQAQQVIGIYFASRSCPACGAFTPQLVSVYNALRTAGKPFEIVMAGVDPASVDLSAYMTQYGMGWLALPLGGVKVTELVTRYNVEWIPTLIVINGAGKTITKNGREDVAAKGAAAFDGWLAASGMP